MAASNALRAALFALPLVPLMDAGEATARDWQIVSQESTLSFSGSQSGKTFEGRFETFGGEISFDPAAPDAASVSLTIEIGSVSTPDSAVAGAISGPEWFDTSAFPQANFTSNRVIALGDNQFEMTGDLTLKSITRPVVINFTFEEADGVSTVTGETQLQRTDFNVGTGQFLSGETIALEVGVGFTLKATAK